jgi:S1-C subfamily serine protease/Tfp pilus assembly protein PilF
MAHRWLAKGVLGGVVLVGGFTTFKTGMWWAGRQPASAVAAPSRVNVATNSPSAKSATTQATKTVSQKSPATPPATRPTNALTPDKIYAQASPAVVQVQVRDASLKPRAIGTGFFVSADGFLVTNFHVIAGASLASVQTSDGRVLFVEGVAAKDEQADLALLKVKGAKLPYLKFASDASTPKVGTRVFAIGNPQGLTNTLSDGLLSGVREVKKGLNVFQTSAPISSGSSGGPLLIEDGSVVGVTSSMLPGGQNLNFAVPAERVQAMMSGDRKIQTIATAAGDAMDPQDALAFARLFVALDRGQLRQASAILVSLRERQSKNPIYWFLDGTLHTMLNNLDLAASSFKQAIKLKPDMAMAHDGLGMVLSNQGKLREAIAQYKNAAKVDPADWVAYQSAGMASSMLGEHEKAIAFFDQALKLQPNRAHLHRFRAQAMADLGKNIDAFASLNAALKLDATDAATYAAIGALHLKLKHAPEAMDALRKSIRLDPTDSRSYMLYGDAAYYARDLKNARAAWQNAIRFDPNGPIGEKARTRLKTVADVSVGGR